VQVTVLLLVVVIAIKGGQDSIRGSITGFGEPTSCNLGESGYVKLNRPIQKHQLHDSLTQLN